MSVYLHCYPDGSEVPTSDSFCGDCLQVNREDLSSNPGKGKLYFLKLNFTNEILQLAFVFILHKISFIFFFESGTDK